MSHYGVIQAQIGKICPKFMDDPGTSWTSPPKWFKWVNLNSFNNSSKLNKFDKLNTFDKFDEVDKFDKFDKF